MGSLAGEPTPLLAMRGITKRWPGVRALDAVDFAVAAGEVHCLLGQNGAGKSTLIKVLAGAIAPDEGEIVWNGQPVALTSPTDALRLGIATIYQELDLVPWMSVAENVALGHEPRRGPFVRRREAADRARRLLADLGHGDLPVDREVALLSPANAQIVSIARALSHDARLIVMDEPSAVLTADEVDTLFRLIARLTERGVAVVYISHRLAEIRRIGNRVTVLKDGQVVARGLDAAATQTAELVRLMTGRTVAYDFPDRPAAPPAPTGAPLLKVRGLGRARAFTDVSFDLHPGEILGIAGLVGSGRSELLRAVFGAERADTGTVELDGRPLRGGTGEAVARGMGMAPEERKSQALVLDQSIARNTTLATMDRYARLGFLDGVREFADAARVLTDLDLRPPDPRRPARALSGGNQQKVVMARWLLRDCRVLLLDEPTRGVDVGAKAEIYALIRDLAAQGRGLVLVSSELPEVLGLADRVLVLHEGRVLTEAPGGMLSESDVLDLILAGARQDRGAEIQEVHP